MNQTYSSQIDEMTPEDGVKKTDSNKRKISPRKIVGFGLALAIPLTAGLITIDLNRNDISVSDFIVGKFKGKFSTRTKDSGEALASQDAREEKIVPSVFADKLEPIFSDPAKIRIPSQNININLINVGVKDDGTMETPTDWGGAGWYVRSGKPGEPRNIVINGHYDDNRGLPAAFFKLKYLNSGDTIDVSDKYGRIFTYKVVELRYVDIKDPNRLEVLEDDEDKSTLTLITCGGVWLPSSGTYNQRLIVKGELISQQEPEQAV